MSAYLRFVLERAGAPSPSRVVIVQHAEEWVNQQLGDEFKEVFPSAELAFEASPAIASGELLVLPFMDNLLTETPVIGALAGRLAGATGSWVILYGVRERSISVFAAGSLNRHCRNVRRTRWVLRAAVRLKLAGLLRRLTRWRAVQ